MPKKFNDKEKQWIRQKLIEEGKRRFESLGLRKTSVEDLTKASGIAQGSFYMFFDSKEELFYHILLEEEAGIRNQLLALVSESAIVTKEGIQRFLLDAIRLLGESPLIRQMYLEGEFTQLVRKLPAELLEQNFSEDTDALMPVIRTWQAAGILVHTRPELIVSMIRSLVLLTLHKQEIGADIYTDTLSFLLDLISDGMVSKRD
ncbi:AcrR family transcriptional regulator [Paenibacillus endophyticus]|uniref:AcrR family transcriptional regulator n=1 Tax=Paenibacillus endophyticus TaxID=1294268 RepID=A0A7W5CE35_9BACL|nr:TetR/AcrR family transcriptional regulator [Paenibacillus endophyticus]MBB3155932.1 AcrR family transcriptional regulator [Paenibacillus endophyticus]